MSTKIDREGTFEAVIASVSITESKEGAVGVNILADIVKDDKGEDWAPYNMTAEGTFWIIKKDGTTNEMAAKQLQAAKWNGSIVDANAGESPAPMTPVQIVVKGEDYKGTTRYKIAFLNPPGSTGGPGGKVEDAKAKELQAKFGSKIRALMGGTAVKPGAAPSKPAPAASKPAPAATAAPDASAVTTKNAAWKAVTHAGISLSDFNTAIAKVKEQTGKEEAQFVAEDWQAVTVEAGIPF